MPRSAHDMSAASSADRCADPCAGVRPAGCERYESPVIHRLFQLHHMIMRVGDRMAQPHGLTSSRWMLLCELGKAEDARTVAEISDSLLLSAQNVSRMVSSMEQDGLVERFNVPGAGRSVYVRLTAAGWDAYAVTRGLAEAFMAPFLEGVSETRAKRLDKDLGQLIENTQRLEKSLIAGETPGPNGDGR